uniref:Putative kinase 098L n=1 Tax=Lygus hesperus TaxID=30085 RepID=A0A0A9XYH3_LYGHE
MTEEHEKLLRYSNGDINLAALNVSFSKLSDSECIDSVFLDLHNLDLTYLDTEACDLSCVAPAAGCSDQPPSLDRTLLQLVQPIPDRLVNVCIKYPLLGEPSELHASLQALHNRVRVYRQFETWRCPHLVRYYGSHGFGAVFEFVDGPTLEDLLQSDECVTISLLGKHVSIALLYIQYLGFSHNFVSTHTLCFIPSRKIWKVMHLGGCSAGVSDSTDIYDFGML